MVLNVKLGSRRDFDPADDPDLGRSWIGYDPAASDQDLWEHNRGRYAFGSAVDVEKVATLSFDGTIRVVARLTGACDYTPRPGKAKDYWALVGEVLVPGHPAYDALIGQPDRTHRGWTYLPDPPEVEALAHWTEDLPDDPDELTEPHEPTGEAFLLTWNPDRFPIDQELFDDWASDTASGLPSPARWSTGKRTSGIADGDAVYLLRQGSGPRGIVAAGVATGGGIYQEEHWQEDAPGEANYVDLEWHSVVDPMAPLSVEALRAQLPSPHDWSPQASGTRIDEEDASRLAELWAEHLAAAEDSEAASRRASRQQGRQLDALLRTEIEDEAQRQLEEHYRGQTPPWTVQDVRTEGPYDARATRAGDTLFLEAKGTVGAGEKVLVTEGERAWAEQHPGQCVLGVVSGIEVADGHVVEGSGTLRLYDWAPEPELLEPTQWRLTLADDLRLP